MIDMRKASRDVLAENIRQRRQKMGLTQDQLAQRLGQRQPYIARLERGEFTASLDRLDELAEALDVSPADLLTADIFSTAVA